MDDPAYSRALDVTPEEPGHVDLGTAPTRTDMDPQPFGESRNECGEQSSQGTLVSKDKEIEAEPVYDPHDRGFRKIIRNFTPSWYVVTMGTGIVATLLHQLPYNGHWLGILSVIFFVLNVVLFVAFSIVSALRYALYPELWGAMVRHPQQSLYLGTVPTAFATLINLTVLICVPAWGQALATVAWVLWWIDVVVAVAVCFHMTFMVISIQRGDLSAMAATWLLPVLPAVMGAASGGLIAPVLPNPQHQQWTLIISYVLWGCSIPLALAILILYFFRLTVHEPPPKEVIVSVFLPIGPLGLGGYVFLLLGKVALRVFPATKALPLVPAAGEMLYVSGFLVELVMWGFGLVWFFFAVSTIARARKFPFNMGWWSFTFPIGVFALSTISLGDELESRFFKVLGTILTVCVVLLWAVVAVGTLQRSLTGEMFYAPCLDTDMKLRRLLARKLAAPKASGEKIA